MCELHLLEICSCPKPWSSGEAFEVLIGWFVCVAGASEKCLGTCVDGCVRGSQPVRARVGAGKALTASRLPAWHQNRWMSLIVTVCNVLNSIISCLSLCRSVQHLSLVRSLAEAVAESPGGAAADSGRSHDFIYHAGRSSTSSPGSNNWDKRLLTIMFLVKGMVQHFILFWERDETNNWCLCVKY